MAVTVRVLRRLQVSLLNVLLLLTTVALGIVLWRNASEVVPLRNDVRALRKELGDFTVADASQIYMKRMRGVSNQIWKWRIYLPAGNYSLNAYIGVTKKTYPDWNSQWISEFQESSTGRSGPVGSGEVTLELAISEYYGQWWLRYGYLDQIQGTMEIAPSDGWLADLEKFEQLSDADYLEPKSFDPKHPVMLLFVRRGTIRHEGSKWFADRPVGPAETLVVWISKQ